MVAKVVPNIVDIFNQQTISEEFSGIEKKLRLVQTGSVRDPESTGLLVLDLLLSGGIVPGSWLTMVGAESSAKCLIGSSLVPTDKGLLKLEEIYLDSHLTSVQGITTCDPFLVATHLGTREIVMHVHINKGLTYSVQTNLGDIIEGLPDHKIAVLKDHEFIWRRLDEVGDLENTYIPKKIGHRLFSALPAKLNYKPDLHSIYKLKKSTKDLGDVTFPKEMTEDLAEIIGWIVSEGSDTFASDQAMLYQFDQLMLKVFKVGYSSERQFHSLVQDFFAKVVGGTFPAFRTVPVCIRTSPLHMQIAFLRSLFEGSDIVNGRIKYATISLDLAQGVKYLLENIGMLCSLTESTACAIDGYQVYTVAINRIHVKDFQRVIGFISDRKKAELQQLVEAELIDESDQTDSANILPGADLVIPLIQLVNEASSLGIKMDQVNSVVTCGRLTRKKWKEIVTVVTPLLDKLPIKARSIVYKINEYEQYYWTDVNSAHSTGLQKLVYDLSVESTHSYYVNGTISHNSSIVQTVLNKSIVNEIPRIIYFDYEGSFSDTYFKNIGTIAGNKNSMQQIFGVLGPDGKYLIPPKIRYYSSQIAEDFFDLLYHMEATLPDKLQHEDQWYYVFDKDVKTKYEKIMNKALWTETGRVWVPAPDGKMQALIAVDSYPAMLPRNSDVEDKKEAMASQALMFSNQMKRVKGRLRQKRITVLGVNQLREKPGVMYGSPFYEPCGNAVKFYTDARLTLAARANPNGKGQTEEEPSINGGTDVYRYVFMKTTKNKLSTPNLEGWSRIWVSDDEGNSMGFDPVFDTYSFLKDTGLLTGTKNRMKIAIPQMLDGQHKPLTWLNFKKIINGDTNMIRSTLQEIGVEKPFFLRKACFNMFPKIMDKYFETLRKKGSVKEEVSE